MVGARPKTFLRSAGLLCALVAIATAAVATAAEPTEIKVKVIDQATQAPIAGAELAVSIDRDKATTKTDESGTAVIPVPDEPARYVSVTATSPGFSPVIASWSGYEQPMHLPADVTLPLPKAETVGGRVLDADDHAVAGATVTVSFRLGGERSNLRSAISYEQVTTDNDGRWSFANAPAGWSEMSLGAYHLQRGGNSEGYFNFPDINDETAKQALRGQTHEQRLKPSRLIKGRVIDKDGKPIAGAEVAIGNDRIASNALPPVKSDADGHYEIGVVPDADATLTIKEIRHSPELLRVKNSATLGEVNVTLGPAHPLTGRVVDAAGNPIAHAGVAVDTWRGARTLNGRVETDEDGRFRFKAAPADAVICDIFAAGYADQRGISLVAGKDQTITLAAPVKFQGTVIDADTRKPIASFVPIEGVLFDDSRPPSFQRRPSDAQRVQNESGTFERTFSYPYPARVIRVEADGYAPLDSPKFTMSGGDQQFTFEMHRAAGVTGVVQNTEGKAVAGAEVYCVTAGNGLQVQNGRVPEYAARDGVHGKTDEQGTFSLPPQNDDFVLYITSEHGAAEVTREAFAAGAPIKLTPWASVSGTLFIGSKPAAGGTVEGWSQRQFDPKKPSVMDSINATADSAGHFAIDRVPPHEWQIGRRIDLGGMTTTVTAAQPLKPSPGEHLEITLGNRGRPVTGRVELPAELRGRDDWSAMFFSLATKPELPPPPKTREQLAAMSQEERTAFATSPEAKAWQEKASAAYAQVKNFQARLALDGTFRFDDVEPGTYELTGQIMQRPAGRAGGFGETLATIKSPPVTVTAGNVDEPIELSSISVTMKKTLAVGQMAPDFDVPTLDGGHVKLSDLRGKVVVVDFWATWCGPCVAEIPEVKRAFDQLKDDPNFAMVSLSLDDKIDAPKAFTAKQGMTWTQGFLGSWSDAKVPAEYGVEGIPAMFVIDAEGKVAAKNFRGDSMAEAVKKALATR